MHSSYLVIDYPNQDLGIFINCLLTQIYNITANNDKILLIHIMSKICNQRKDDDNKKLVKQDAVLFKYLTSQPEKDSEQHLAPKLSENSCNDIKRLFRSNSTSSSPTNPFQYVESKDDEYWDFIDTMQIPRSGSPVGLSVSSSPSVYYDALRNFRNQ